MKDGPVTKPRSQFILVLLLLVAGVSIGARPTIPKIYGKSYDSARKVLIRAGWSPNKRLASHGESVSVQSGNGPIFWQRGYWELEVCSGTGSASCLFEFIDPSGRLLEVVTEGEEDEAGTYHARVRRVYLKKKK